MNVLNIFPNHLPKHEKDRGKGLILRTGAYAFMSQRSEKRFDLSVSHIFWMAHLMKADKSLCPIDICIFCLVGKMLQARFIADAIQKGGHYITPSTADWSSSIEDLR